jgi:phosphoribosylamine--glycine ligase
MRVLILSKEGDGLGVAHKLQQEGNQVSVYIKEPRFAMAGQGIIKRIPTWREGVTKTDLILCDMVGFGHLEERLRLFGVPIMSCSYILEQTEFDRTKGMQLFRACGIDIPETYSCSSTKEAADRLAEADWSTGWVLKPCGNISTAKTMVIKDKEILAWALSTIPNGELIIQKVVEGIEVSTEGWYNGRDFLRPFNHTFEEKCFLNDNLGPATGCMGNVVFAAPSNRLTKATVEKLGPFLSTIGYRGPVDVNCIVTESGAFGLEITARLGYDAIEAILEGLQEPAIDLFFEVAQGTKKTMKLTSDTMMSVRLSVPPWPHAKPTSENEGSPVTGLTPEVLKHVAITDLYLDKADGLYKTAAGDGVLLKATATGRATGDDLTREARNRVYRTLDNIHVSGKQYRTDIGKRVNNDMKKLKEWGWL